MNDLYEARIRIEKVDAVTSELRRRLTIAHEELLEVERMGDRSDAGLLVVDRADDLRRQLSGSLHDLTLPIRPALEVAENAYFASAISGEIDASHARTMIGWSCRVLEKSAGSSSRSMMPGGPCGQLSPHRRPTRGCLSD